MRLAAAGAAVGVLGHAKDDVRSWVDEIMQAGGTVDQRFPLGWAGSMASDTSAASIRR